MASLRDKTISGMFWTFGQQFGSKGVGMLTTIILARLLTPEDFGLVAMLSIFISVSQGIADGGFNQALIQKKEADDEDYSSVFFINLIVSLLLYFLLFFSAPFIASFYEQPQLTVLTRVLSLVFIINSFSYVQKSRLSKNMQFKTLMLIHLPSIVISAFVAICMAYLGYGVWSLVAQQLTQRFAYAVQIWIYSKWHPLWVLNLEKVKSLFSFGSRLMLSSILHNIYENIYSLIIGKYFPVDTLGYYKASDNLVKTPTNVLSNAIKSVTFPVFSSIQNDNKRLKTGYRKTIQLVFFCLCPIMILASVLAEPLFRFVLTEKWMPAVPFFRLLCIIGIIGPVNSFNLDVVVVKGKGNLYLKLNIVKKIIIAVGIAISVQFGIWALLIFQVLNIFISYIINGHFSGKLINYPIKEQLKDISPLFVLSISVGAIVFLLDSFLYNFSDLIRLIVGGSLGVSSYWLISKYMNFETYYEIKSIVLNKIKIR